ncbi:hypothetical protein EDD86DRAFT_254987 [Gorgonomyces haynaldii]|nr:hypothetical protein EDD86DRAFT_254987 [Gorgonomyces haynaldii]
MGQSNSLQENDLKDLEGYQFDRLEIEKLYKRFQTLDKQNTGTITVEQLMALPELAVNPLAHRLVKVFQLHKRQEINFVQFLQMLSPFSSNAPRIQKLEFAFKIYDVDGDGLIDYDDLFEIVRQMVGSSLNDDQIDSIVKETILEADIMDRDGAISFAEFRRVMFNTPIEEMLTIQLH